MDSASFYAIVKKMYIDSIWVFSNNEHFIKEGKLHKLKTLSPTKTLSYFAAENIISFVYRQNIRNSHITDLASCTMCCTYNY